MNENVTWECKPRTKAKLEILKNYLDAWFNILANGGFPHAVYIDGFCGPGEYSTGEKGSPIIALKFASDAAEKYPNFSATLIFIDKNSEAIAHLQQMDEFKNFNPKVEIKFFNKEFAKALPEVLALVSPNNSSPTFSFVDPFGISQSPYESLRGLIERNSNSELFINFMCSFAGRFAGHKELKIREGIRNLVGSEDLDSIINSPDRIQALCETYDDNLCELGKYVRKFMMLDEKNLPSNALFFCGNHFRGLEEMKKAMWKVDPENGNYFSAYQQRKEDVFSGNLFEKSAQTGRLSRQLMEKFSGQKNIPVSDLITWTTEETDFLDSHLRKELEILYSQEHKITFYDPEGKKRSRGNWPPRLLISFS